MATKQHHSIVAALPLLDRQRPERTAKWQNETLPYRKLSALFKKARKWWNWKRYEASAPRIKTRGLNAVERALLLEFVGPRGRR